MKLTKEKEYKIQDIFGGLEVRHKNKILLIVKLSSLCRSADNLI